MADIQIVPSLFSKEGNVVAFIERLDGSALPADVDALGFAGMSVQVRIESPDNRRIYFTPPGGLDGSVSQVSLPSGDVLALDSDAIYVDEQLACVGSLRPQMAVLRDLARARVLSDRQNGIPEDIVEARYWAVLTAGHLRFGDALEGVDNAAPPADQNAEEMEVNALSEEHASELEFLQASLFTQA
jgi:hypothetical protein